MNRRRFSALTGASVIGLNGCRSLSEPKTTFGENPFDQEVESFMADRRVPGASLSVSRDGQEVYRQAYGVADRDSGEKVTTRSLFRVASISKPLTAVAILKLIQDGKLRLQDRILDFLVQRPFLSHGVKMDPRWREVTVQHCLQHTGGWDRDKSFDPMFRSREFADRLGHAPPSGVDSVIRVMLGRVLDFDPGQRYAYSNFGYCLLGRTLESVTGMSYATWMEKHLLAPLGIHSMRLGKTRWSERLKGEVRYHMPSEEKATTVIEASEKKVPWPYGGFYLEAMDAHGGWLSSASDLVRFTEAVLAGDVIEDVWLKTMVAPPEAPVWRRGDGTVNDYFYGYGWLVRPKGEKGFNLWHSGSLPGTRTLLVHRWDGWTWAILFNQRQNLVGKPDSAIDAALHRAANRFSAV